MLYLESGQTWMQLEQQNSPCRAFVIDRWQNIEFTTVPFNKCVKSHYKKNFDVVE